MKNNTTQETAEKINNLAKEAKKYTAQEIHNIAVEGGCRALENFGINDDTTEDLADLIEDAAEEATFQKAFNIVGDRITTNSLANVKSGRYWADVAIRSLANVAVTGLTVGAGMVLMKKFSQTERTADSLFDEKVSSKDPFADTAAVGTRSRRGATSHQTVGHA